KVGDWAKTLATLATLNNQQLQLSPNTQTAISNLYADSVQREALATKAKTRIQKFASNIANEQWAQVQRDLLTLNATHMYFLDASTIQHYESLVRHVNDSLKARAAGVLPYEIEVAVNKHIVSEKEAVKIVRGVFEDRTYDTLTVTVKSLMNTRVQDKTTYDVTFEGLVYPASNEGVAVSNLQVNVPVNVDCTPLRLVQSDIKMRVKIHSPTPYTTTIPVNIIG
ncbi:MAG: hypothetical protein ACRC5C_11190, partial [Bacilli bacterium]